MIHYEHFIVLHLVAKPKLYGIIHIRISTSIYYTSTVYFLYNYRCNNTDELNECGKMKFVSAFVRVLGIFYFNFRFLPRNESQQKRI